MADEKKPATPGGIMGFLDALLGVGTASLVAVLSGIKNWSVDQVTDGVEGVVEDIRFGLEHHGVVLANRVGAFWHACIWIYLIHLIGVWLGEGLFLASLYSILWFSLWQVMRVGLYLYGWPVTSAGALDHREWRLPVDRAAREVAQLQAMQRAKDPNFDVANLMAAIQEHATRQAEYEQRVREQGAQGRSALGLLFGHFAVSVLEGFTLVYGVVGQHANGTYSYDQVVWHVVGGCFLPLFIYLAPLAILLLISPFGFSRAGNVEDVITFLRLSIKAAGVLQKGFPEIEKEHLATMAANGDQPFRNASLVAKQHWMEFWSWTGVKVLMAEGLLVWHCLPWPSLIAFVWSVFLGLLKWFYEKARDKHNVLSESTGDWFSRFLGAAAFLVYPHMLLAGGAPRGFWGPNFYWSDYGPFADLVGPSHVGDNFDTVRGASGTVGSAASTYAGHVWHMSAAGTIFFAFVLAGVLFLYTRYGGIVSAELEKIKVGWLRKGIVGIIGVFSLVFLLLTAKVLFQTPVALNRVHHAEAAPRRTIETGNLESDCERFDNKPPCAARCFRYQDPPWPADEASIRRAANEQRCRIISWSPDYLRRPAR